MQIGRFIAGVGVLIEDPTNHKYLILRRSREKDFAAGVWECVTGRVDQGEGFEDAAHREVLEELSIEIELVALLGTTHFYRGDPRPDNELIGVVYLGRQKGTRSLRLSQEHDQYRWVTLDEVRRILAGDNEAETWLITVMERARLITKHMPSKLVSHFRQHGFELD